MSNYFIGDKYLITTDQWFFAPDGSQYKAVYGTIKGVHEDKQVLDIKTNARSTNWYVEIGNMTVAGCQIHYAVRTNNCACDAMQACEIEYEGKVNMVNKMSRIFNADA